jgi:ketosteroid isomerase-like protein
VLAVLALSCRKETDPVRRLLNDLEEAAEARDAEAVLKRLAPDFRGQNGLRRADAGAELRRYFFGYEKIDVTLSDVAVEPAGDDAYVRLRIDVSGKPTGVGGLEGLLPAASAYRFSLELKKTGEAWLIAAATWERIDLNAPPPTR